MLRQIKKPAVAGSFIWRGRVYPLLNPTLVSWVLRNQKVRPTFLVSRSEHKFVKDGETGFVYDFENLAGVAEGLRTLARSRELVREMGHAGMEKVVEKFDIEALIGQTLDVYQRVAEIGPNCH